MSERAVITKIEEVEANPCPPRGSAWFAGALTLVLIWLTYKSVQIGSRIWERQLLADRLVATSGISPEKNKTFSKNFDEFLILDQELRAMLSGSVTTDFLATVAYSLGINLNEKIGVLPPESANFKPLLINPTEADVERVIEVMRPTSIDANVIDSLEEAHDQLVAIREDQQKRRDLIAKQDEIRRSMHRLRADYEQLGEETAQIFNLSPWLPSADFFDPNLYTVGLLKDLPALTGLPDGLNSVQELEAALAKLHAVPPTGPEIQPKISSFRTRGLALATEVEQITRTFKENETTLEALGNESDREEESSLAGVIASVQQAVQRLVNK